MTRKTSRYIDRARNELTEHLIYGMLARHEKNPANKNLLEKLSSQEKIHYEFWRSLAGDAKITPYTTGLVLIPILRTLLGVTFTTKFLETHEKKAIQTYTQMLADMPAEHRRHLEKIIDDEKTHEQAFINDLKERRVTYIGFIALGLADAIVEITGVHAGFLGVTGSTLIAGVSGIIVGFAAAISMGSAAYLQAKQDVKQSPIASALVTGISYLASVILLALPYFFIRAMMTAFIASTSVGLALLAAFTFYGAVLFERPFSREFIESASLMLGTALATFILGNIIGGAFHIGSQNF